MCVASNYEILSAQQLNNPKRKQAQKVRKLTLGLEK